MPTQPERSGSAATGREFPHLLVHHPDDEKLTVEEALDTLRGQHLQRYAVLMEWLAERLILVEGMLVVAASGMSKEDRDEIEKAFNEGTEPKPVEAAVSTPAAERQR